MDKNLAMQIHHIGYMVRNISKARAAFESLGFVSEAEQVFFDSDRVCDFLFMENGCKQRVELICPKDESSPMWNLSRRYKNMPYHICLETADIDAAIEMLTAQPPSNAVAEVSTRENMSSGGGYTLILPPARALAIGENARVAFLNSPSAGIVELLEL